MTTGTRFANCQTQTVRITGPGAASPAAAGAYTTPA